MGLFLMGCVIEIWFPLLREDHTRITGERYFSKIHSCWLTHLWLHIGYSGILRRLHFYFNRRLGEKEENRPFGLWPLCETCNRVKLLFVIISKR